MSAPNSHAVSKPPRPDEIAPILENWAVVAEFFRSRNWPDTSLGHAAMFLHTELPKAMAALANVSDRNAIIEECARAVEDLPVGEHDCDDLEEELIHMDCMEAIRALKISAAPQERSQPTGKGAEATVDIPGSPAGAAPSLDAAALDSVRERSAPCVVVPTVPTPAMTVAILQANMEHDKLYPTDGVPRSHRIHRAMIAAANEPAEKTP